METTATLFDDVVELNPALEPTQAFLSPVVCKYAACFPTATLFAAPSEVIIAKAPTATFEPDVASLNKA